MVHDLCTLFWTTVKAMNISAGLGCTATISWASAYLNKVHCRSLR